MIYSNYTYMIGGIVVKEEKTIVKKVNTDLYKIAGNGLVTNCISLIIEHLYKANVNESYICEDELYETV